MQINCLLNALSLTCCDRLSWTHWCKENHQRQLQTTGHYTPSQPWSWYQRDVISQVNFCGWFEKKRKKLNKSETQKWGQTSWRSMQKSLIFATFWAVLEFKEGTFDRSAVSADRNSISASAVFNIDPRRKAKHRLLRKIYWAMIKARQNTGRQILRGNCRRTLILPFSNACMRLVALTWTDGPGTTSRMKRHQGVGLLTRPAGTSAHHQDPTGILEALLLTRRPKRTVCDTGLSDVWFQQEYRTQYLYCLWIT